MNSFGKSRIGNRYQSVTVEKSSGATYTPKSLADFVAWQIVEASKSLLSKNTIRILDPAIGNGELLISLLQKLDGQTHIEVFGFDTDESALFQAEQRLKNLFPNISINLEKGNFLHYVLTHFNGINSLPLFITEIPSKFDLIIANPPYVRTQIIGAQQANQISRQFNLGGRVDLYHAFLIAMATVLEPNGIAGIIVSNRFMTTKSGSLIRAKLRNNLNLLHIWDLGDTKIFDAAVLPAVILAAGKKNTKSEIPTFTTIYETPEAAEFEVKDPIAALSKSGVVSVANGRSYEVKHGKLDVNGESDSVWRIATDAGDAWLATVKANSWGTFRDIGKIRVGVKTCADKIYIRSDWNLLFPIEQPELLRPLTTHHVARRFKAHNPKKQRKILYTHKSVNKRRQTIDIEQYPSVKMYLEQHRATLEARTYVIEAGRKWYEIWVPQDPAAWELPKLIFRDISEKPIFWIDKEKTIVNGDCYWMIADKPENEDLLWLAAAVANSTFAEAFYDHRFNNKLYSGRRRFITQYVEQFPLPEPTRKISRRIIDMAKEIYETVGTSEADNLENVLNSLVWQAFGFSVEEIVR